MVIVKKKDGTLRFCVDFRKLNDVTIKDAHPLSQIDDTLEALKGAKFFSTLDLGIGNSQSKRNTRARQLFKPVQASFTNLASYLLGYATLPPPLAG